MGLLVGAVLSCQAVLVSTAGAFTFSAAPGSPYGFPGTAESAALGDFNGDGLPDFAVGVNSHSPSNPGGTASVSMMLADGAGGFRYASGSAQVQSSSQLGEGGISVAAADFNGDGRLDLAATDKPDIWILPGNGDGTFGSPLSKVPDDRYGVKVVVADFNGDHRPDLAVGNDDGTTSIYLGNGDGTFNPAPGSPIAARLTEVDDVNGDGKPDLLVAGSALGPRGSSSTVSVLLGNGDGTFRPAPGTPTTIPGSDYWSLAVADFNGDGKPDLGVVSGVAQGDTDTYSDTASVLLGKGDGSFTPAPGSTIRFNGPAAVRVLAGDFNSDGKQDLAFAGVMQYSASVSLLLGDGSGHFRFASGSPFALGQPGSAYRPITLAGGSFDGRQGLLVAYGNPYDDLVAVLLAPPSSEPPTAALSARPTSALTGTPMLLDASASSDPLDRQIVDYRWDLGTGRFDHDTGSNPTISWRFSKPGTRQVRVQVTNSVGQTATEGARLVVRRPPPNAVVAGYVQVCGGPAPGRCRIEKFGLCTRPRGCMTSDRVAAIDSTGRRVAVTKLRRGRFRLVLKPGRYTIELFADGKHVRGRVLRRRHATARAHRTATIRFRFDVP